MSTLTDADGKFELAGMRKEEVRLRASKRGWSMVARKAPPPRSSREESLPLLDADDALAAAGALDVRIVMQPVWAITFVAIDALSGSPVENARLSFRGNPGDPARWDLAGGDDADWFSGDEPDFRAHRAYFSERKSPGDAPPEVTLRIAALGYEDTTLSVAPLPPTDPEYLRPRRVVMKPLGEPGTLRITVRLGGVAVQGPFLLTIGEPSRRVPLRISLLDLSPDGAYRLTIPAGVYRAAIVGSSPFQTLDSEPMDVTVRGGTETPLTFDLVAGVITLRLRDAEGRGLDGARVRVTSRDRFARSWLLWKHEWSSMRNPAFASWVDSSEVGDFRIYLTPGSYNVKVGCYGHRDHDFWDLLVVEGQDTSTTWVLERDK